ncbi:DUF3846 domain-containing protein (plasmid) [Streptomyces sp. NBC_00464]|uniref:DUF3846 domain-containing protein n=1 Tax=Streptomyces sp. NBC_00464 TaxID=2975751 RepID=UPI002E16FE82
MTTPQRPYALILRTNGSFQIIDWPTDGHLNIYYTEIGCTHVDAVDVSPTITMWLDDEGMINGSPVNRTATILYAMHREPHQHYHGNAVITGGTDRHGDTLGLTRDQVTSLVELHLMIGTVAVPAQSTK